jgi:hypothetical protein
VRRKEINGQSISFNPSGIDIYPQHFVPIQHGSGGFIDKKMVVSRRSCSTLYMGATFIAVDVLLPHGFFLPKVFFFSWAGPGISVAIVHQPKDRSSLPLNHRLCILYTTRPPVCVFVEENNTLTVLYILKEMGEAELLCDRSDPITADAAAKCQCRYALCVCVCVWAARRETHFFTGHVLLCAGPSGSEFTGKLSRAAAGWPCVCVCVQTPEMVNRIFLSPHRRELSRIIIIIIIT